MRLWHQLLIPHLDRQRLLGQHRECCALRGKGWGKRHSTVNYVFKYDLAHLYAYHCIVMSELVNRGYSVNGNWYSRLYRGSNLPSTSLNVVGSYVYNTFSHNASNLWSCSTEYKLVYPEHDMAYLKECLLNLKSKNAELVNGVTVDELLVKIDLL